MSNATGNYETTTKAMYEAYDKLPKLVRERLSEAVDDWVPQPLLTLYRRSLKDGKWTGEASDAVIARIEHWDAIERTEHRYRMERMAKSGTDYHARIRSRKALHRG